MTSLQRQFLGFLATPFLWKQNQIKNLQQFDLQNTYNKQFNVKLQNNYRLGKLVERFVSEEINYDSSIEILAENIQIQDNKTTLGELDCLLRKNGKPIHLEIVYKFYLYDASVGTSEIDRWIGPNRRDSFIQKLTKLKEKQLSLLYHEKTKPYLNELGIASEEVEQQVYFKAQLFVPLEDFGKNYPIVNNDCIIGFYIYPKELKQFSDCKFFIPTKHNWLVKPYEQIDWLNFEDYTTRINVFLSQENNPLCWMKKPKGEMVKFFVVYW